MEIGKTLTTGNIAIGEFQTSGSINIGTGTARVLGGQGSEINIGTGSAVANPIKIGSGTSVITLNGDVNVLPVSNNGGTTGVLYGQTGYDTVSGNYTIPVAINNNYFLRISGTGSPTITLPVPVQHQILTIRSVSTGTITISATSGATIFTIGATAGTAGASISAGGCLKLYAISTTNWYEI